MQIVAEQAAIGRVSLAALSVQGTLARMVLLVAKRFVDGGRPPSAIAAVCERSRWRGGRYACTRRRNATPRRMRGVFELRVG